MEYITAETNQISKVDWLSISSFLHCCHISPFRFASIVTWVYLSSHLSERLPLLKSTTSGLTTSLNAPTCIGGKRFKKSISRASSTDLSYSYALLIIYLCQTFKSYFFFQFSSTSLLECISLDHPCQIW